MRTIKFLIVLFLVGVAPGEAVAQRRPQPKPPDPYFTPTNEATAKERLEALDAKVQQLESDVVALEYRLDKESHVRLDTTSTGFARLTSNNGTFLIAVTKVEPYLDGFKLYLDVGNLTSASFRGFDLSLAWNTEPPAALKEYKEWFKTRKQRTQRFTQSLISGTWNKAEFILPATQSKELGFLELSMTTDVVALK